MKRNRYFIIVILSSLLFFACLLMLFRKQSQQDPAEGKTETIDFSELGKTEETPLSENTETQIQTEQKTDHDAAKTPEDEMPENKLTEEKLSEEKPSENKLSEEELSEDTAAYDADTAFYTTGLTEELKARITGKSYPDTTEPIQISYDALAYVHILHYDFQAQVQEGELICNQAIAQDLLDIFRELYEHQYPIEKVWLIDEYNADDELSMADNNTSCFNYRTVPGKSKLSNHSYGRAIDINPLYNPYVRTKDGKVLVSPQNAEEYADRNADFPYKIDREDLCYQLFTEHGFEWGGAWNSSKDYQHFEKNS